MNIGRRSFLGLAAATGAAGCVSMPKGALDDNLTVFVTDIHVSGLPDAQPHPLACLNRFVNEVLAMHPRPKRVVSLGDLAYLHGLPEDYEKSKPVLKRLEDAGIELVFAMGNHDRRSAFKAAWPGHAEKSPVPGRLMRVVSLGTADLVVLDGLQGSDDRSRTDMGPGNAKLFPDVFAWCKKELPKRERPFFVCSHWPVQEFTYPVKSKSTGKMKQTDFGKWLISNAPQCKGYIYGHHHKWRPEWMTLKWSEPYSMRTLCLPSNGFWGDIGHAVFRAESDRATCSVEMRDFFFPREPETSARPLAWRLKVEETRGQHVTFAYDRGEEAFRKVLV